MKKAVGHLIPFMEKEREEKLAEQGVGPEDDLSVSISSQYHLSNLSSVYFWLMEPCYGALQVFLSRWKSKTRWQLRKKALNHYSQSNQKKIVDRKIKKRWNFNGLHWSSNISFFRRILLVIIILLFVLLFSEPIQWNNCLGYCQRGCTRYWQEYCGSCVGLQQLQVKWYTIVLS